MMSNVRTPTRMGIVRLPWGYVGIPENPLILCLGISRRAADTIGAIQVIRW